MAPDDTDPAVADTQSSDPGGGEQITVKRRAVNAGDTLGRYELVEEVGEGGMATVYRARDKELRRDVALKVLFPHLARRPEVVRRFHREARAAAGLEHANILRIYDVGGEGDDPPFIVMELIRGRTLLAEIEQRGPMLAEMVACVGALLADALVAAHKAGIIHRDIKPANVLIAGDGRLLLADFGVARLETEDSLVTRTGALLGTPAYMSPEQASGDIATAKSDLYSLGATLYQLATGSLPYGGAPAKILAQIAQGALVAPVRRRAAVGPDLSRVIERLMAVEAEARPNSAAHVAAELRGIAAAGGLGEASDEVKAYFADPGAFVTARMPAVVTAVVAAAQRAIGEAKLPRAIALADRASALAPDDPAVTTLIEKVTEGGRASRRRRVLAAVAGVVVVAGGATGAVLALRGGEGPASPPRDAAQVIALAADAAPVVDAAVELDAPPVMPPVDAAPPRVRADARRSDAAPVVLDAPASIAPAVAIDAAIEIDAAVARGAIIVQSDTWCDVSIDKLPRGRRSDRPIPVEAGAHTVVCEQKDNKRQWTQTVDVGPGETRTVTGAMLATVNVTIGVPEAKLEGVTRHQGDVVPLKAGRKEIEVAGQKRFIDVRASCTVRAPDYDCYP